MTNVASVIVPVHTLGPPLDRCLLSLESLDFPDDQYEIVVVTDGVEPGTYFDDFHVHLVRSQGSGPSAARNAGIAVARGDFVAFTDSDCLVHDRWLTELLGCFTAEEIAGAGGSQQSPDDECRFGSRVQQCPASSSSPQCRQLHLPKLQGGLGGRSPTSS